MSLLEVRLPVQATDTQTVVQLAQTHSSNNILSYLTGCSIDLALDESEFAEAWSSNGRPPPPSSLLHLIPSVPPLTYAIQPLNMDGEGYKAWQTPQCAMIKCSAGERRSGRLTRWERLAQLNADSHLVSSRLSKSDRDQSICGRRENKLCFRNCAGINHSFKQKVIPPHTEQNRVSTLFPLHKT